MEIKGKIGRGSSVSLTCCTDIEDITIDDKSLYQMLMELFDEDEQEHWENHVNGKRLFMRYVVTEEKFDETYSFEQVVAETVNSMLYSEHISGCYSEWTCGYGGFDYIVQDGRSIFTELESYIGKYLHLKLDFNEEFEDE